MKRIITIVSRHEHSDRSYLMSRSDQERTAAVEFLRQQWWASLGDDKFPPLERIITIRKRNAE